MSRKAPMAIFLLILTVLVITQSIERFASNADSSSAEWLKKESSVNVPEHVCRLNSWISRERFCNSLGGKSARTSCICRCVFGVIEIKRKIRCKMLSVDTIQIKTWQRLRRFASNDDDDGDEDGSCIDHHKCQKFVNKHGCNGSVRDKCPRKCGLCGSTPTPTEKPSSPSLPTTKAKTTRFSTVKTSTKTSTRAGLTKAATTSPNSSSSLSTGKARTTEATTTGTTAATATTGTTEALSSQSVISNASTTSTTSATTKAATGATTPTDTTQATPSSSVTSDASINTATTATTIAATGATKPTDTTQATPRSSVTSDASINTATTATIETEAIASTSALSAFTETPSPEQRPTTSKEEPRISSSTERIVQTEPLVEGDVDAQHKAVPRSTWLPVAGAVAGGILFIMVIVFLAYIIKRYTSARGNSRNSKGLKTDLELYEVPQEPANSRVTCKYECPVVKDTSNIYEPLAKASQATKQRVLSTKSTQQCVVTNDNNYACLKANTADPKVAKSKELVQSAYASLAGNVATTAKPVNNIYAKLESAVQPDEISLGRPGVDGNLYACLEEPSAGSEDSEPTDLDNNVYACLESETTDDNSKGLMDSINDTPPGYFSLEEPGLENKAFEPDYSYSYAEAALYCKRQPRATDKFAGDTSENRADEEKGFPRKHHKQDKLDGLKNRDSAIYEIPDDRPSDKQGSRIKNESPNYHSLEGQGQEPPVYQALVGPNRATQGLYQGLSTM
ncbi:cell wall protein DAN4 [Nematostella vectensis]|uniref:cell wall protein DAN4 n=1 Tax=Nematostella vectensis TaxID=45351 RepID=UPI00207720FE|nr:cell wall protein DAN4 [Nematostella vectensis]